MRNSKTGRIIRKNNYKTCHSNNENNCYESYLDNQYGKKEKETKLVISVTQIKLKIGKEIKLRTKNIYN